MGNSKKKNRHKHSSSSASYFSRRFSKPTPENWQSLIVLDQFSSADLAEWETVSKDLQNFQHQFFSVLDAQRRAHYQPLLDSLSVSATLSYEFKSWNRIVDFEYGDAPLSARGYKFGIGGRFNYGVRLDERHFQPFPALYIAEDLQTAYKERLGVEASECKELSPKDFALMPNTSHIVLAVSGQINNILDLRDRKSVRLFSKLIADFQIPKEILVHANKMSLKVPDLVRTPKRLLDSLFHAGWRSLPMHFDLPANSQLFGKMVRDAGVEGILYPSARGIGCCLCLFVENLKESESFVELAEPIPSFVQYRRLDKDTYTNLI